jgi:hypothetical protein
MSMYHTDPPPLYEEFLHGPIPRKKTLLTMCPNPKCRSMQVMWSPLVNGVSVCPYCNTRLINKLSTPHQF